MQALIAQNKEMQPEQFKTLLGGFVYSRFDNVDKWAEHPELLNSEIDEQIADIEKLQTDLKQIMPQNSQIDLDIQLLL